MRHYYRQQTRSDAEQAQIDRINAENAPLNNAISAIGGVLNSSINQHQQCMTDNFNNTVCGYNCYVDQFGSGHCASN